MEMNGLEMLENITDMELLLHHDQRYHDTVL